MPTRLSLGLALLGGVAAETYAAVAAKAGCSGVGCAGYYRAFAATTSPALSSFGPPSTVTGISLAAVGVEVAANGTAAGGKIDIAGFKFKTPADTSDAANPSLSFYFGYLGASGVWDNTTQTANVNGALAEVVSAIASLDVYYNRDGVAGFQWDLNAGNDIFNCVSGTYDCVDANGVLDVNKLAWSPIARAVANCVDLVPNGDYAADCKVYTLTTSGALSGTTTNVLTITARIASQPLKVNGVVIKSDSAKFDVQINFPWSNFTSLKDPAKALVALVGVQAGKAESASAVATIGINGGKSLVFNAAGGKAAYFSYASTARIGTTDTTIVTKTLSSDDIINFSCAGKPCALSLTALLMFDLNVKARWLLTFGWTPQITIHSFTSAKPVDIFWDPEVGAGDPPARTNSGGMLIPGVALLALLAFA